MARETSSGLDIGHKTKKKNLGSVQIFGLSTRTGELAPREMGCNGGTGCGLADWFMIKLQCLRYIYREILEKEEVPRGQSVPRAVRRT